LISRGEEGKMAMATELVLVLVLGTGTGSSSSSLERSITSAEAPPDLITVSSVGALWYLGLFLFF
jgi:hypothetical protein